MAAPMEVNIWRAPTDNDRKIRLEWKAAGYDRSKARAYDTTWEIRRGVAGCVNDESVIIHSTMSVAAAALQSVLDIRSPVEGREHRRNLCNHAGKKRHGISTASTVWASVIFKERV